MADKAKSIQESHLHELDQIVLIAYQKFAQIVQVVETNLQNNEAKKLLSFIAVCFQEISSVVSFFYFF